MQGGTVGQRPVPPNVRRGTGARPKIEPRRETPRWGVSTVYASLPLSLPRLTLAPGKDRPLRSGYPWVFAGQIARVDGSPKTGDVVALADAHGEPLGLGFFHETSLVAFRLLTRDIAATIDAAFFRRRLERALALRQRYFGLDASHYRLAYAEADGLPGTIIDRYGDVLTVSTHSAGMDARQGWMVDALVDLVQPRAVVERNDGALRKKDGLEERAGLLYGLYDGPIRFDEHGVTYEVDVLGGLKTGFFLDQRLNRWEVRKWASGQRVLDVFCADGGFGLHAAAGGAAAVHFLDSSQAALDRARANASASGLDGVPMTFERADAVVRLGQMAKEGQRHDLVVLDPPAFARSKKHRDTALRAYQRINISGMQLLEDGGLLATASCSGAITPQDFRDVVAYSAHRAGVRLTLLHEAGHAPDHPVLEAMPETRYLKFLLFRVER
ncbi:MAG: class I SAM-dependent rRNA methyltransferase [Rhodothermales bacterium]|nr:class I SAM-dependent rRNA methyltransferase [Rhodothermales bacterium]